MPAILDGLGISGLDRQRAIVGGERILVVAELALGVSEVVPGLVHAATAASMACANLRNAVL